MQSTDELITMLHGSDPRPRPWVTFVALLHKAGKRIGPVAAILAVVIVATLAITLGVWRSGFNGELDRMRIAVFPLVGGETASDYSTEDRWLLDAIDWWDETSLVTTSRCPTHYVETVNRPCPYQGLVSWRGNSGRTLRARIEVRERR